MVIYKMHTIVRRGCNHTNGSLCDTNSLLQFHIPDPSLPPRHNKQNCCGWARSPLPRTGLGRCELPELHSVSQTYFQSWQNNWFMLQTCLVSNMNQRSSSSSPPLHAEELMMSALCSGSAVVAILPPNSLQIIQHLSYKKKHAAVNWWLIRKLGLLSCKRRSGTDTHTSALQD